MNFVQNSVPTLQHLNVDREKVLKLIQTLAPANLMGVMPFLLLRLKSVMMQSLKLCT